MSRDLGVYLGDQRAGTLAQDDTGALTFSHPAHRFAGSHRVRGGMVISELYRI